MKRIAILGSTGSIGRSALAVVDAHGDRLSVVGLAAGENAELLGEQIARYRPNRVAMASGEALDRLRAAGVKDGVLAGAGRDGLVAVATAPDVDLVLCASSGTEGLEAVLAAIESGKTIALANKEVLVMAGGIVTEAARRRGVTILPVDSEHNAIHQCLHGRDASEIRRLILTASGGPFRGRRASELLAVTAEEALRHPTWRMGRKITIDSATLMNKGLEVIEAHWLYDVEYDAIEVVIHPQSVVHSAVRFVDGSLKAQLGTPDMRLPIQYALTYPDRRRSPAAPPDLIATGRLEFRPPDEKRFPALRIAREAGRMGPRASAALIAADEVAVARFLDGTLGFTGIPRLLEAAVARYGIGAGDPNVDELVELDREVRSSFATIPFGGPA
jgi:1-deoxy-D-xylulose-5-phosphate reductoisomerase